MSVPKLGGRTSSYRKPVPKFIPSPPASPQGSPTSSTRRLSFSHTSIGLDAPPLPSDWRDVIERAVLRERRTTYTLPAIDTVASCPDVHGDDKGLCVERLTPSNTDFGTSRTMAFTPPTPTGSFCDEEPVSRPNSPTPWAYSLRSTAKLPSYQEEYRPPTPPLSTQRKRSRSTGSGCDSPTLTLISQLTGPHPTLVVASRDSQHDAVASILSEKSEPPPPPPPPKSPLPTRPGSSLTHDLVSLPYHAGHDKTSQPHYVPTVSSTFIPGHDRRPSTLNSTLNFTVNSEKWTENNAPSVHALVKTEAPGDASGFPLHPNRDRGSVPKRRWWQSFARGFKRFVTGLGCL